jgi:hypothetical protein
MVIQPRRTDVLAVYWYLQYVFGLFTHLKDSCMIWFFGLIEPFFGGLQSVGHSFAYVGHFVFLMSGFEPESCRSKHAGALLT